MNINVTSYFETYREAARHLRNTYFSTRDTESWDVVDDFRVVDRLLFERLVLFRIPTGNISVTHQDIQSFRFRIHPNGSGIPIMISRTVGSSGYWDHSITSLLPNDAEIAFLEYFDWDQHALIDFRYYRCTIIDSVRHPEIRGHHALIQTSNAQVHYTNTAEQGAAANP